MTAALLKGRGADKLMLGGKKLYKDIKLLSNVFLQAVSGHYPVHVICK